MSDIVVDGSGDTIGVLGVKFYNCNQITSSQLEVLRPIKQLYPNFDVWLNKVFLPDLMVKNRSVVTMYNLDGVLVGIALLKHTELECKICTLYILSDFRGMKYGELLLNECCRILTGNCIIISVSEECNRWYYYKLSKLGFVLTASAQNCYRPGAQEYFDKLN